MSAFDNHLETEFCYGCQRERLNCTHTQGDNDTESELTTCEICGAIGLPERIQEHDCRAFLKGHSRGVTDGCESTTASSEGDR